MPKSKMTSKRVGRVVRQTPQRAASAVRKPINDTNELLPADTRQQREQGLAVLARRQKDSAARAGNVRLG